MKANAKKTISTLAERNKHILLMAYFLLYFPWFAHLERTVTNHFHVIHVALDDYIPFCEYFVIPYLLWFFYVAWGILYFFRNNKEEYFRLCTVLFTGMTVFLIISTIYPNGHYLRPTEFERQNIFTALVGMLYATDTPTNLFPSIHVFNSIAVNMAVWHSGNFRHKKAVRFCSAILMISIILSTMFLKQHSVFDVVTGIALAVFMYTIVYNRKPTAVPLLQKKLRRGKLRRI